MCYIYGVFLPMKFHIIFDTVKSVYIEGSPLIISIEKCFSFSVN